MVTTATTNFSIMALRLATCSSVDGGNMELEPDITNDGILLRIFLEG
jgi:hypothetical protein